MKKLFSFRRKKERPEVATVYGITTGEYCRIERELDEELTRAASRQRPGASGPSAYMRGLLFAIDLLNSVKPHEVGVQK